VDHKTAQTRLGQSDIRLTLGVYAQVSSAADREAAEVLGTRFRGRRRHPGSADRGVFAELPA
jgi:hypothetical protein